MENSESLNISTLVVFGTMGVLILVSFIVVFVVFYQKKALEQRNLMNERETQFQKTLLNASLEIAEQERSKVAANIHDDVGMILNVLKLKINKAARSPGDGDATKSLLTESNKLIEETIDTIRGISNDLMPPALSKIGLMSAFFEMCHQLTATGMLEAEFETSEEEFDWDKKKQVQLYRVVKEILNNILKHGKPTKIKLVAEIKNQVLTVTVIHNGRGVTSEEIKRLTDVSKGLGLKSIMARAQLIDAKINYIANENSNAKVTIETPLL